MFDLGGAALDIALIQAPTAPDAGNALNLEMTPLCQDSLGELGGSGPARAGSDLPAPSSGVGGWRHIVRGEVILRQLVRPE